MSRRREARRHRLPELNLTPLIDVVFNLLIFVLVTASFSQPDSVPAELPILPERAPRATPWSLRSERR
jgi:biopolymer transport protein ExbD